jgi:Zn-dependent oligopeptidase
MYTVFKKDPLDPELGKRYRDKILRVGGSREELDSLKVNILRSIWLRKAHTINAIGFPWKRTQ